MTTPKQTPLLMRPELVRATIAGRKTQTRRIVKHQERLATVVGRNALGKLDGSVLPVLPEWQRNALLESCPYGKPGDRLYVKERWRTAKELDNCNAKQIAEKCLDANYARPWCPVEYGDGTRRNWDTACWGEPGRWRSNRFMPGFVCRLWLELTAVRVERVQEISEADLKRELDWSQYTIPDGSDPWAVFAELWDEINGNGSFDLNPFVWVLSYKPINPNGTP